MIFAGRTLPRLFMKRKSLKKAPEPSKNSKLPLALVVILAITGAVAWYFKSKPTPIASPSQRLRALRHGWKCYVLRFTFHVSVLLFLTM